MRNVQALVVVSLAVVLTLVVACVAPSPAAPTGAQQPEEGLSGEVPIGYIAASPDHVETTLPSVEIAIEDVNEYAASLGHDVQFKLYAENAETSAVKALENAQTLYARGVRFIVGPNWSSMCKSILDYANENGILVVSDGSTAPELAIADDNLFRLPATDETQTEALAKGVLDEIGLDAIVVLQRADAWGDGNYKFIEQNFGAIGGEIASRIRYNAEKREFSAEVRELDQAVGEAIEKYGEDNVAVAVWSFEEIVPIVTEAANYENLMRVPWIGSNGITRSTRLVEEATDAVDDMKILSMMIGVSRSDKYEQFREKYMAETDTEPTAYVTFAYDAVWLLTEALLEVDEYDAEKAQEIFPEIAANYVGAGGSYDLNEYGDRAAATFEVWTITTQDGAPVWERAATYDMSANETTWIQRPDWAGSGS